MLIEAAELFRMYSKRSRTGPAINSPVNKCAGCPFAGICTPCRPTAVINKVALSNIREGSIVFRPTGTEVVRPISPEKTCSQCGKNSNTCPHSAKN